MEPLTEKQQRILKFIEGRLQAGQAPTQQQIADNFGITQNAVCQLVGYLRKKGYLASTTGHRNLCLSEPYLRSTRFRNALPLVGHVAAGEPILAEERIEKYVEIDKLLGLSQGDFLLRIRGDSMIDAGIMDGDLVVVKPSAEVRSGHIAVVMLDDEATVKRVFFEKDRIALKPANAAAGYKTRYIRRQEKDVRIVGRVVGSLRTL